MPTVENVQIEKRERPSTTPTNPTMESLLGSQDRKGWVKVQFPKNTGFFDTEGRAITHQAITLNTRTFEPGQEHTLHPLIARELQESIARSTEATALQFQKRNRANIPTYVTSRPDGRAEVVEDYDSMFEQREQLT